MKNTTLFLSLMTASLFPLSMSSCSQEAHHYYKCESPEDIHAFMNQQGPIISGHRGGNMPGYPENCLETFDKILESMPTFYEIDPRMTKDSVIVLMHDSTIDRTTTGKGKVKDYTFEELQQFRLLDKWGNVTEYKIPSFEDVVKWSMGKVILNFDTKDVTRDVLVPFVNSFGARNCIYTVVNSDQAKVVYQADSTARMSAWVKDIKQLESYRQAGIPMKNIALAYVCTDEMKPENQELYDALHELGIPCMVSTSPRQDYGKTTEERQDMYKACLTTCPDIIETDFPLEFLPLL